MPKRSKKSNIAYRQKRAQKYQQKIYTIDESFQEFPVGSDERIAALRSQYKRLAKTADQRLVRLEKYKDEPNFKNILSMSYSEAMLAIKYMFGGGTRFNQKLNDMNEKQLRAGINNTLLFLNSLSSTKTGYVKSMTEKSKTTNERYGTDFTWQDMGKIVMSEQFKNLSKEFGSKTMMKTIGEVTRDKEAIVESMQEDTNKITIDDAWDVMNAIEDGKINPFDILTDE